MWNSALSISPVSVFVRSGDKQTATHVFESQKPRLWTCLPVVKSRVGPPRAVRTLASQLAQLGRGVLLLFCWSHVRQLWASCNNPDQLRLNGANSLPECFNLLATFVSQGLEGREL